MNAAILEDLFNSASAIVEPNGYFQLTPRPDGGFIIRPKAEKAPRLIEVSVNGNDQLNLWSRIRNHFGGNVLACGWSKAETDFAKELLIKEILNAEAIVRLCVIDPKADPK